jgi:hypothetical protein
LGELAQPLLFLFCALPSCEAYDMVSTVDLRTLAERLACIASRTHTFSVQIGKVLHVEAFRRTGCEHSVVRMRITAPISELDRIHILVARALGESLLTPTPSTTGRKSEHHNDE